MQIDTSNLAALSDSNLSMLGAAWEAERDRRNVIAQYADRQVLAQTQMQAAIAADTASATAYSASAVYQPGASVSESSLIYWRPAPGTITNDDPATSTHWVKLPNQAATVTPWASGMPLAKGELVSNGGHTYQWAQAAVASAPANYAPTGTVSTASWTFVD